LRLVWQDVYKTQIWDVRTDATLVLPLCFYGKY